MQHQNLFVFDIETIPDTKSARNLLDLDKNVSDDEAVKSLTKYHLDLTDQRNAFLRQPFHKVIVISFLEAEIIRDFNGQEFYRLKDIRCGGEINSSESELVKGFFSHLKKNLSRLVSFNGKNFDLPVLKYAAMKNSVEATWLYKSGDKWNNYNQKYSLDWHCDLADAFSDFGASAKVKMNELCACFNLPGKIGIDGSMVFDLFKKNSLQEIRDYCETDVLNTYLLYLIYQHHNGSISQESFKKCQENLQEFLEKKSSQKTHFKEFLNEWRKNND
jgi:hypothetical protein